MGNYSKKPQPNRSTFHSGIKKDVERERQDALLLIEYEVRAVGKREGYTAKIIEFAILRQQEAYLATGRLR